MGDRFPFGMPEKVCTEYGPGYWWGFADLGHWRLMAMVWLIKFEPGLPCKGHMAFVWADQLQPVRKDGSCAQEVRAARPSKG